MKTKTIFVFNGYENLHAEADGTFWLNDLPCRKVYNSGTIQIRRGKFSVGLNKLRKLAIKKEVEINQCPF